MHVLDGKTYKKQLFIEQETLLTFIRTIRFLVT